MGRCNLVTCDLRPAKLPVDDPLKDQQVVFLIESGISVVGTPVVWFLIPNVSTIVLDDLFTTMDADHQPSIQGLSKKKMIVSRLI
jgi:hypothetical protein